MFSNPRFGAILMAAIASLKPQYGRGMQMARAAEMLSITPHAGGFSSGFHPHAPGRKPTGAAAHQRAARKLQNIRARAPK